MSELDLTREALGALGEAATHEQLAAYARDRHGAVLDLRFVPLYRATLKDEEQRRRARARLLDQDRLRGPS
jgi:hypothetical protein